MTCKRCGHSGEDHDFQNAICLKKGCFCMQFEEAIGECSVFLDYVKYLNQMVEVEDKIRFLLTNIKFLRNFKNKDFVFAYWVYCDGLVLNKPITLSLAKRLTDPETIRRAKQKLVERNREAYGELDPNVTFEKQLKQMGILEYVITT